MGGGGGGREFQGEAQPKKWEREGRAWGRACALVPCEAWTKYRKGAVGSEAERARAPSVEIPTGSE